MKRRRVLVTGMGTVNALGSNLAETWEAVRAGRCGIGEITAFDTNGFSVKLAAEARNFNVDELLGKREARRYARFTQFALVAADEAVKDAAFEMDKEDAGRFGVIISSGIGGLPTIEAEHTKAMERGFEKVSPLFIPMSIANMAAAQVALRQGWKGMCASPLTACAGGSNAVGDAFHRIRDGYEDVILCGGAEAAISSLGIGGFSSMKALSTATDPDRASIPFDRERSGFVMGEGSGLLVLEEEEHARKRGAKIYGEIAGYGANCDAYHFTAPAPGGLGAALCMELALADAGMKKSEIGYINAHGTGTPMNDVCETAAIHKAFGELAASIPVSSTKAMTGHMLGAAGGMEAILCLMALKEAYLPATINYREADPECDLDYIPNVGRNIQVKSAMSNSLGFGGHNASLIFRQYEGGWV